MDTKDYKTTEAEAKYNAVKYKIGKNMNKHKIRNTIIYVSLMVFIITILVSAFLPKDKYGNVIDTNANMLPMVSLLSIITLVIGTIILPTEPIFLDNKREEIFYYIYSAYENRRSENVKSLLTSAIRKIEDIIDEYKDLPFSEKVVSELNILHDTFLYRLYPHPDTQKPTDNEKSEGWGNVKDIAIDIIDNSLTEEKIKDFDSKLAKLNFERKESVKLEDEKEPLRVRLIKIHKGRYNKSLIFRLISWAIGISIVSYIIFYFFSLVISSEVIGGIIAITIIAATTQKEI